MVVGSRRKTKAPFAAATMQESHLAPGGNSAAGCHPEMGSRGTQDLQIRCQGAAAWALCTMCVHAAGGTIQLSQRPSP